VAAEFELSQTCTDIQKMRAVRVAHVGLIWAAALRLCAPPSAFAAANEPGPPLPITNVELTEGGTLIGQAVDSQGAAQAGLLVSVWNQQRQIAQTITDLKGHFAIHGLRGGVYRLTIHPIWPDTFDANGCSPAGAQTRLDMPPGTRQSKTNKRLVDGGTQAAYRLWTPDTAPPVARQAVLVVTPKHTVRGQCGGLLGSMQYCLADRRVLCGLAAAAIAVPIAVHSAQKPSSP
jgi:hypothetical protein